MTGISWPVAAVLAASFVPGVANFFVPEQRSGLRSVLNIGSATLKLILVAWLLVGVHGGDVYQIRVPLLGGVDLVLNADPLSMLFVSLSASLWLVTTIYAIGYLEDSSHRSRFFGFFSLCVTSTAGVALAGNLLTLLLFYEMLTLATYPLVVHRGTPEALAGGRVYLTYTLSGGAVLLVSVVWLRSLAGPLDFTQTGLLQAATSLDQGTLRFLFFLFVAGFGVKAALVPLHGWLPRAMVAPAPVSALLHAVAVVKAGAFGLVRLVYEVYGIEFADSLGVLGPLALAAAITIMWGSIRALAQDDIKKRLAFSTVSQVSYIALGMAVVGPIATIGALVHLVHQGITKITLFFCAGNLATTLGVHHVSEMSGVGRRMPFTMGAFTVAALGMIGVPPMAGFFSKWYLATGGVAVGADWVLAVLAASSLLNAAYFLPVIYRTWFQAPTHTWPREHSPDSGRVETTWLMLAPPLVTAAATLAVGLFAASGASPLGWASFITASEFLP